MRRIYYYTLKGSLMLPLTVSRTQESVAIRDDRKKIVAGSTLDSVKRLFVYLQVIAYWQVRRLSAFGNKKLPEAGTGRRRQRRA